MSEKSTMTFISILDLLSKRQSTMLPILHYRNLAPPFPNLGRMDGIEARINRINLMGCASISEWRARLSIPNALWPAGEEQERSK